ncbi:MAG: hypothetical protein A3E78_12465 [Alphaproteobacteria bacterium RIFCSPHIGHO2_12_FULL_63_12]|nr:MAG: hypothetical protein A3E78_12465 [Alphaproteobacteria bacterium RIFCSPHIGHO2_12_FULL_63_12]
MKRILLIAVCTTATALGAAAAKPPHKNAAHAEHERSGGADFNVSIILGDREREVVRNHYTANCPPGLAKKRNGCLPPGLAKKRYAVGQRMPDDADIVILPNEVILRLPPLPRGYGYRVVDGDLVVVALASLIIADAIGIF